MKLKSIQFFSIVNWALWRSFLFSVSIEETLDKKLDNLALNFDSILVDDWFFSFPCLDDVYIKFTFTREKKTN